MRHRRLTLTIWIALVACAPASEAVQIRLRPTSVVRSRAVTVADVAELSGGLPMLRDNIARLDVSDVPRDARSTTVSRKHLQFRLTLAGLPATTFQVIGAELARVTLQQAPVRAEEVVTAARQALLATLPWSADQILIDLAQPVVVPLPAVTPDETVTIKAEPHAGQRTTGRVQVDVRIFVQGECRLALPVQFHVRPCQKVVVCRKRIEKGEALDDSNTFVESHPVDGKSSLALPPEAGKGAKAQKPLLPGQVVQRDDVETGEKPALIRAQDSVKIQVRLGGLRVTAAGQALQEGRVGQLIRVQNVDSRKVVIGRVIEGGLVEVE